MAQPHASVEFEPRAFLLLVDTLFHSQYTEQNIQEWKNEPSEICGREPLEI